MLDFGDARVNRLTRREAMAEAEAAMGGAIHPYDFVSEGDSPSFMMLFDFNGLRSSENPTWGGWGGRFEVTPTGWSDAKDYNPELGEMDHNYAQARWIGALQRDFAARLDWGIASTYGAANHAPVARIQGDLDRVVQPGEIVKLEGHASDPDGDALSFRWWHYREAGNLLDAYEGAAAAARGVSVRVPVAAPPGATIHYIFEATDDGTPALRHYQRVVLTVAQ